MGDFRTNLRDRFGMRRMDGHAYNQTGEIARGEYFHGSADAVVLRDICIVPLPYLEFVMTRPHLPEQVVRKSRASPARFSTTKLQASRVIVPRPWVESKTHVGADCSDSQSLF